MSDPKVTLSDTGRVMLDKHQKLGVPLIEFLAKRATPESWWRDEA